MRYWWASQGGNYEAAITAGSLWTIRQPDGSWLWHRAPIIELKPGDLVIHHAHGVVRAVSRVRHAAVEAPRPPENPRPRDDRDDGYLVRVEVLRDDLELGQAEFSAVIPHGEGVGGPLTREGFAKQAFLQPLEPELAAAILMAAGLHPAEFVDPGPAPYSWSGEVAATDAIGVATLRREQGKLRSFLLGSNSTGTCDLCGRDLPADLLVAAHIQPRSELTDQQRIQFDCIAMLACVLGCDALFEAGYVAVGKSGTIVAGRQPPTAALARSVATLVGRACRRHDDRTAPFFAARAASTDT